MVNSSVNNGHQSQSINHQYAMRGGRAKKRDVKANEKKMGLQSSGNPAQAGTPGNSNESHARKIFMKGMK